MSETEKRKNSTDSRTRTGRNTHRDGSRAVSRSVSRDAPRDPYMDAPRASSRDSSRESSRVGSERRNSTSSYGGTISDIEAEDYKRLAKKLNKDKEKLKDKLRRLLDEVEDKSEEHRKEMEKSQNYFEEQLNDLTEERDKAYDDLENMRDAMIAEKEKIRNNFEEKLNKHKESLEKRYGSKDSQVVKRLENTIVLLQERVNQQIEERERLKDTTEQFYTQREENLRQTITDLEEQFRKLKDTQIKDRQDMNKTAKTFNDEKEFMIAKLRKEKEDEIANIIAEKNAAFVSLQSLKEQIEKRAKNADIQRDEEICKMKFEVADSKRNFETKYSESTIAFKNTIAEIKQQYEGKLYSQEQQHKTELEQRHKEYENNYYNITGETSRKIEHVITEKDNKITELTTTLARLNKQLETGTGADSKRYEQIISDLQSQCETKDRDIKDSYLRHEKIVGELTESNIRLKEQLTIVKDNTKKLQDYSQNVNSQMVNTLTKQKEQAEKDTATRDTTIDKLERQLKKTTEESIDRVNSAERKLKNTLEDLKEISDKYTSTKLLVDKREKDMLLQKDELLRVKETNDMYVEKLRKSHFEKELLESKVKTFEDMIKTRDVTTESEKNRNSQLQSQFQNLQIRLKELEFELDRKNKSTKALQTDLDNANKTLSVTTSESVKVKNQLTDDLKKSVSQITLEKDRVIEDMKKSYSQLEHTYKFQIAQKEKDMDILRSQFADNIRKEVVRITTEKDRTIEECKKRLLEVENTLKLESKNKEQDIDSLKNQLNNSHRIELSKVITDKDKIIEENKKRLLELENTLVSQSRNKELEYHNMKNKLTETHRIELTKAIVDKEKSIEENKKRLSDTENKFSTELRNKDSEIQSVRDKLSESSKLEMSKIKGDKDRVIDEYKKKITELENKLTSVYLSKDNEVHSIREKINEINRTEISKMATERDRIVEEHKKKISELESKLSASDVNKETEIQNIKNKIIEATRQEIQKISIEKDRTIDELKKRNVGLEKDISLSLHETMKNINLAKEELRKDHSKTIFDKDKVNEDLRKKISQLEHELLVQAQVRQKLSDQVDVSKKDREELSQLRIEVHRLSEKSLKSDQLQGVLQEGKNRLQESVAKLTHEHSLQIQKLQDKLADVTKRLQASEDLCDRTKTAYNAYVDSESKKNGPEAKSKIGELERERDSLLAQLASSDKKIQQLQYDIAAATATLRIKSQTLDERESTLRKTEDALRAAPPKLLDPAIKKSRDDALIHLRQSKLELGKVKEESMSLLQKLTIAEETIADIEKEKNLILKSQVEIKQTFIDNLNQQQQQHDKELRDKNTRIKELEEMLIDKIKN
jgi:chromosome segregation ATPase